MKTRLLIFFLILPILVVSLCSFKETDDFFRYEIINDSEIHIIAFAGEAFSKNVEIPEKIEGLPVTTIREGAFYNNPFIEKIIIPGNVEMIESSAFAYCKNLESIVFQSSDKKITISQFSFEMCSSLRKIEFSTRETYIDDYAFENCKMLGKVYFPKNISHIGHLAFNGCESIIFDCEESLIAQDYAKENNIPTKFLMSDDFLLVIIVGSSVFLFVIIMIVFKIQKKYKKNKNS